MIPHGRWALKRSNAYLKNIEMIGGNAVLDGGKNFAGSVAEHWFNVDQGTEKVTLNLTANEGTKYALMVFKVQNRILP